MPLPSCNGSAASSGAVFCLPSSPNKVSPQHLRPWKPQPMVTLACLAKTAQVMLPYIVSYNFLPGKCHLLPHK